MTNEEGGVGEAVKSSRLSVAEPKLVAPSGAKFKIGLRGRAAIATALGRKPTDEEIAALEAQMSEEIK